MRENYILIYQRVQIFTFEISMVMVVVKTIRMDRYSSEQRVNAKKCSHLMILDTTRSERVYGWFYGWMTKRGWNHEAKWRQYNFDAFYVGIPILLHEPNKTPSFVSYTLLMQAINMLWCDFRFFPSSFFFTLFCSLDLFVCGSYCTGDRM